MPPDNCGFINPSTKLKKIDVLPSQNRALVTAESQNERLENIYKTSETPMFIQTYPPHTGMRIDSSDDEDEGYRLDKDPLNHVTNEPNFDFRQGGLKRPQEESRE